MTKSVLPNRQPAPKAVQWGGGRGSSVLSSSAKAPSRSAPPASKPSGAPPRPHAGQKRPAEGSWGGAAAKQARHGAWQHAAADDDDEEEEDDMEDEDEELDEEDEGDDSHTSRAPQGGWGQPQQKKQRSWQDQQQSWREQQQKRKEEEEKKREDRRLEEEKKREDRRLEAQKREKIALKQSKFGEAVKGESFEMAVEAINDLLELELKPQNVLLQRLLESAARKAGQADFVRVLSSCSKLNMKIDVHVFVKILVLLMQRGKMAFLAVRIALNMVLPKGAPKIPMIPPDTEYFASEGEMFEDGEMAAEDKKEELDKKKEQSEQKAQTAQKEGKEIMEGRPARIEFCNCTNNTNLNGIYERTDAYKEYLEHEWPTYRKGEDDKALYAYYWEDPDDQNLIGWYIAEEVGAEVSLGFNPDQTTTAPPGSGWRIRVGTDTISWPLPADEEAGFDFTVNCAPKDDAKKLEEARQRKEEEKRLQEEQERREEEERNAWPPKKLVFAYSQASPVLNGEYEIAEGYTEYLEHDRPVYKKIEKDIFTYFWYDKEAPWRSGWWIGSEVGGDLVCGFNASSEAEIPPETNWQINKVDDDGKFGRRLDTGGFYQVDPGEKKVVEKELPEDVEECIRKLDLTSLHGMVQADDDKKLAYFSHFCTLLHLEHLCEIASIRRRLEQRSYEQLTKWGFTLSDLPVKAIFNQKHKGRPSLPGKSDVGSERVCFQLPHGTDPEKLRFRRGDSVVISETDPLKDPVGEGLLLEVGDYDEAQVQLEGAHMPDNYRSKRWRLDHAANRTAYERQLLALMLVAKAPQQQKQSGSWHGKGGGKKGDGWQDQAWSQPHWWVSQQTAALQKSKPLIDILTTASVGVVDEWAEKMKDNLNKKTEEKMKEEDPTGPADTEDGWMQYFEAVDAEIDKAKSASSNTDVARLCEARPQDQKPLKDARRALTKVAALNITQRQAVNAAMVRRCTIVQGPPGTGKTHVSVALLSLFARELGQKPLLATSDSNVAVDNIAEGLVKAGIKVVRVGRPEKVQTHLEQFTLESKLKTYKKEREQKVQEEAAQIQENKAAKAELERKRKAAEQKIARENAAREARQKRQAAERVERERKRKEEMEARIAKLEEERKKKMQELESRMKTAAEEREKHRAARELERKQAEEERALKAKQAAEERALKAKREAEERVLKAKREAEERALKAKQEAKRTKATKKDATKVRTKATVKTKAVANPGSSLPSQSPTKAKEAAAKKSEEAVAKKASDEAAAQKAADMEIEELRNMKVSDLKKLAKKEDAATPDQLEAADDEDDVKGCIIDLILNHRRAQSKQDEAKLKTDLMAKKVSELKKIARSKGVSEGSLDATDDAPNVKEALAMLIIEASAGETDDKNEDKDEVKKEEDENDGVTDMAEGDPHGQEPDAEVPNDEEELEGMDEDIEDEQAGEDDLTEPSPDELALDENDEEEAARKQAEEEEEAARKQAEEEEEAARQQAEEEAARKQEEEEEAARKQEEAEAEERAEEEAKLQQELEEEEARLRKEMEEEEEQMQREKEEEEEKMREEQEREEEELRLAQEEEEKRLADERAIKDRFDAKKKLRQEDYQIQMELLEEAEVICTTSIGAGSDFLSDFSYKVVLVDEVAQATELSTIVPIVLRGASRMVLVGDHCQLPPSVQSLESETRGLSLSLYSRLVGQGVEPFFLNTQYRSHPKIAEFSAGAFYYGQLRSGTPASKRPACQGFPWPSSEAPVAFVDCAKPEQADGDSKTNPGEIEQVFQILQNVLAAGELSCLEIGVVTPYQAQVRAMRQRIRQGLAPLLKRLRNSGGGWDENWQKYDAKFLEIASIDAFQGREKELIIFSAVRSNRRGMVGFLADWRRLNVMLTRARRGLVVVGTASTLKHDPCWQQWLEWCEEHEAVIRNERVAEVLKDYAPPRPQWGGGGSWDRGKGGAAWGGGGGGGWNGGGGTATPKPKVRPSSGPSKAKGGGKGGWQQSW